MVKRLKPCCDGRMGRVNGAGKIVASERRRGTATLLDLPASWRRHVVPQRHADYSRTAHETWRRLLARSAELVEEFHPRLHPAYVDGFRCFILPWSKIPRLSEINEALADFGWSTVCVDGYLPPDIYAGLLARGVFPVSRKIRRLDQLDFSPMPDLAHDLLGHIPMLISPGHRQFLRRLAACMASEQPSALDQQLYLANRASARLRCSTTCLPDELAAADARVESIHRLLDRTPSAFTQLARLYLWSIEFGLMGTRREFRLYGAGLLSSPVETRAVCGGHAPVRDISLDAVRRNIHFSEFQSMYFVAADFAHLNQLLTSLRKQFLHRRLPTAGKRGKHRATSGA